MTPTRTISTRLTLVAALGLTLIAGACGSSSPKAASNGGATTTTAGSNDPNDSAYCQTARKWMVHEFNGDGDTVADDPVAFGKYMREYLTFTATAKQQAPAELRDEFATGYDFLITKLKPLFEKYDYDIERIKSEGTPAELAIGQHADSGPTPAEQGAQDAVHAYEGKVCDTGQPPAADVSFAGAKPTPAYCETVKAADEAAGKVAEQKWSVAAVRAFATSDDYAALTAEAKKNAPAEIKADVIADADWSANQQVDVLAKYGYDVRKLVLEGSHADRQAFQKSDPAIADHYARTVAYEEQLCGEGE